MNEACKALNCNQPCCVIGVDYSVPFKVHVRPKGEVIIGWDSIYGKYCYFHEKVRKGLISGVIKEEESKKPF